MIPPPEANRLLPLPNAGGMILPEANHPFRMLGDMISASDPNEIGITLLLRFFLFFFGFSSVFQHFGV